MTYHVTEPHPSVNTTKKSAYLPAGRGGAGNFTRYVTSGLTSGPAATGPASRTLLAPPTSAHMMTGRGGAGNAVRSSNSNPTQITTVTSTATRPSTSTTRSSSSSTSPAAVAQRAIFSFDEELQRDQRMQDNAARVYSIGIGGAGNTFSAFANKGMGKRTSSSSAGSDSSSSVSSVESRRRGVMERLSRTLSRS